MATLQTLGIAFLVVILIGLLVISIIMATSKFGIKLTDALKQMQRGIVLTIGYLVFMFIWLLGLVTMLNNQDFSKEFRFFLDRAGEGEDLIVNAAPRSVLGKRK